MSAVADILVNVDVNVLMFMLVHGSLGWPYRLQKSSSIIVTLSVEFSEAKTAPYRLHLFRTLPADSGHTPH